MASAEARADAVACELGSSLLRHVESDSPEVRSLVCEALAALANTLVGAQHVVKVGAVPHLCARLVDVCPAATTALVALAETRIGCAMLLSCSSRPVHCLADIMLRGQQGKDHPEALTRAVRVLDRLACADDGNHQCLDAHVPAALLGHLHRVCELSSKWTQPDRRALRVQVLECMCQLARTHYGRVQLLESFPGERPEKADLLVLVNRTLEKGLEVTMCDVNMMRAASRLLMLLSIEVEFKVAVANAAMMTLVSMLRDAQRLVETDVIDLGVLENGRDVIENMIENPVLMLRLNQDFSDEDYEKYLGRPKPKTWGRTGK
jgi:hypothetical protein